MVKNLIREPLVHFLLIGAALFVLYYGINESDAVADDTILVTQAEIDQMITLFEKTSMRLPTQAELEGLVNERIKEEVLFREALSLGLDKDDVIVRRRLAQKTTFLLEDLTEFPDPGDETLEAWLAENKEQFVIPKSISFEQAYFSIDKRGVAAEQDAQAAKTEFESLPPDSDRLAKVGDAFMFGYEFEAQSEFLIARVFGADFAAAVIDLEPGVWHGPIGSGYGVHLLYINEVVPATMPPFADIRQKVYAAWGAEQQREANDRIYQALLDQYEVVVETPAAGSAAANES